MAQTNYSASWRKKRADVEAGDPAYNSPEDIRVAGNYDKIANDVEIGAQAAAGLKIAIKDDYPRAEVTCKSTDVAARYLALPSHKGVNNTAVAKAIVDDLGEELISVYQDTAPLFSENKQKAALSIGGDWVCPFVELSSDGKTLTVGYPKRNDAGQTVGITATGSIALD